MVQNGSSAADRVKIEKAGPFVKFMNSADKRFRFRRVEELPVHEIACQRVKLGQCDPEVTSDLRMAGWV